MKETVKVIDSFRGSHRFLSNFYKCKVCYEGLTYHHSEAAFQASKTLDPNEREKFTKHLNPTIAKQRGKKVKLRPDWDVVAVDIMTEVVINKFLQNTELGDKLLATGDAMLIEGNTWNDRYWVVCGGEGHNYLGRILMSVRDSLIQLRDLYGEEGII